MRIFALVLQRRIVDGDQFEVIVSGETFPNPENRPGRRMPSEFPIRNNCQVWINMPSLCCECRNEKKRAEKC